MSGPDPKAVADGLSEAQRQWVLSMPDADREMTPDEWDAMPEALFVQFTPDEFCEESGCYLGGGERFWFGHSTAHYRGDGSPWHLTAGLNELGLAVKRELETRP